MKRIVHARVFKGERQYVAECLDLSLVTQGKTLDRVVENLREAVSVALEGEDCSEFGLVDKPTVLVSFEFPPIEPHPTKATRKKSAAARKVSAVAKRAAG